jgi:hypothetical protein
VWVRWGSFAVYGLKLHLICAPTGWRSLTGALRPANVAEVSLTEEVLAEANLGDGVARKLLCGGVGLPKPGARGGVGRVGDRVLVSAMKPARDDPG